MRREVLITLGLLLAIMLLAEGLRLYRLNAQSLWYDEAFSVYLARMSPSEILARTAADIQPPLYYLLLHGWIQRVGDGEAAVRGLSVLFGVLAVPLMYGVAWQLFKSRRAGLLAALLFAVSPLHLWYAQETRMYTLLVFLCLLSSYLLLIIVSRVPLLSPGRGGHRMEDESSFLWPEGVLWLGFAAASIAALYTHYFALFVLAFQAIYTLAVWGGHGFRSWRLVLGGLAAGVLVVLAYLPWLPFVLTRYMADSSYWPGQLRLGEVLVDIALSFVGGESLAEQPGLSLVAGAGLVGLLAVVGLAMGRSGRPAAAGSGSQTRNPQAETRNPQTAARPAPYPVLFLLLYLLLPPALILALSYNTPKFNARYVMIAQPALLCLWAGGLDALLAAPGRAWAAGRRGLGLLPRTAGTVAAAVALVFLLGVSVYAGRNAYGAPDYARPDFRNAVRYLRHHIEDGETVILTSGHMFPVYDYYARGLKRFLLPDSPTLDTTRTLDYSVGADLNRWLAGKSGVWLVLWQDEVVDPVGYLTTLLDQVGEEQPVAKTFPKVRLKHYHLPDRARFPEDGRPAIAHPAEFNFDNQLRVLGYDQASENQVTLYWEALEPLDEDYRVSLVLRDTLGQSWGRWDGRPTAYLYPTDRWQPGQVIFGRIDLPQVAGRPPGDYGLEIGVYTEADPEGLDVLDQAGTAQGKRAMLGAVTLHGYVVAAGQVEIAHPLVADIGDGLALLGWDLDRLEAQPGDHLLLSLAWDVTAPPRGVYGVQVVVVDGAGQAHDGGTFPPTTQWHPTTVWQVGQAWRGQLTFRVPILAQPGEGQLLIRLIDPEGKAVAAPIELTPLRILPTERVFTPPVPQVLRQADLDGQVLLLGADLSSEPVSAGGTVRITLYWQALVDMDVPYTVFVRVIGSGGQVIAEDNAEPAGGTRPTTTWVPGEYVADPHQVVLPAGLAPGAYVLEVGLYDPGARGSYGRLSVLDAEGQPATDRVIFGPITVK